MKNQDAICELLNQRDALNSIAHLLLNELEEVTEVLKEECRPRHEETIRDAVAIIDHAKKSLLPA